MPAISAAALCELSSRVWPGNVRELRNAIEHAAIGALRIFGHPVQFARAATTTRLPPPLLGQHQAEVLLEWLGR